MQAITDRAGHATREVGVAGLKRPDGKRDKLLLNSISPKPNIDRNKAPFCFVTDYSLRKSRMNIAGALHANTDLLPATLQQPRRLVAWKSAPKLRNLVTFRYNFPLLDEDGNLLPSS